MIITNNHGISLPLAVWLLYDNYDYNNTERYISATTLLKSTKQIILGKRIPAAEREMDVSDFIAARLGHAIHDSVEKAWTVNGRKAMMQLGYPEHISNNIIVNPTKEQLAANPELIPVWMEQRATKEVVIDDKTWLVGGKFDIVIQGRLFDSKSTSVYSYIMGDKDRDYAYQGGIYRWLNPELITEDHVYIQFIFTDWQRAEAKRRDNYPKQRLLEHPVLMPSIEETQDFVVNKIKELARLWNSPEEHIPPCTDKELWRSDPSYKYYSDPEKAKDPSARSSKNFDSLSDANAHLLDKGKGIVITKLGEPKACEYCPAFNICKQKDAYFAERD